MGDSDFRGYVTRLCGMLMIVSVIAAVIVD